jgi:SpoVK/Ycf46/Vps4 family AAA+-type ATPase
MQEKTAPVFVVATANNHESIPPEFLRAGRFDEIFFVDLPNIIEREEIFSILLRKGGHNVKDFNLKILATKTENFSGAEIEKSIDKAMLIGFADKKRKIKTQDIVKCIGEIKTLFAMRNEDFERLRDWADTQCLKANSTEKSDISIDEDIISSKENADDLITNTGRDLEVDE